MNRIGLVGPHGSGKTTLANRLASLLGSNAVVVPDIARLAPVEVGVHSTIEAQNWILEHQMLLENLFRDAESNIIYDGCCVGHLAYYRYWGGRDRGVEELVREASAGFTVLVVLPCQESFLIADGLRPPDPEFQRAIGKLQAEILRTLNLRHIELPIDWPKWNNEELLQVLDEGGLVRNSDHQLVRRQFTIAIGAVIEEGRVLLTQRRSPDIPAADSRWDLPGGTVDFGEDPQVTVQREILEETGYLVTPRRLLPKVMSNSWDLTDGSLENVLVLCYECDLVAKVRFPLFDFKEINAVQWVDLRELKGMTLQTGVNEYLNMLAEDANGQAEG